MEEQEMQVFNMTNFFNHELMMQSLFDIKFKKPVSLKKVGYITLFIIMWTIPVVYFFGIHLDFWFALFALAPPILLGMFASKPIWGTGYPLFPYLKVVFYYLGCPRGWSDFKADNLQENTVLTFEEEVWVSRRRELAMLSMLKEQRTKNRRRKVTA